MNRRDLALKIKELAAFHGFDACGIAPAKHLDRLEPVFRRWLVEGKNAKLDYLGRNFDKRMNPSLLFENCRSVISLAVNYYPEKGQDNRADVPRIAKYALGEDYHRAIKKRMEALCADLKEFTGDFVYRSFTDSAPLPEREWARLAGLGWTGKNASLIIPYRGSYFILSEILTDLDPQYDTPFDPKGLCGNCRRCIMACPTGAIEAPGQINAGKCVAYLTATLAGDIPDEFSGKLGNRLLGCDTCLDACPWNRYKQPASWPEFTPDDRRLNLTRHRWENMSQQEYKTLFKNSSFAGVKLDKIKGTLSRLDPLLTEKKDVFLSDKK